MARILLAESDQHIRRFLAGILADCGHMVETCSNAVDASLSLATQAVDVVVTDFVLGLGCGEANLGRDCAALGIPTVTLSGSEFCPARAVTERPAALLEKPFRFGDLHSVLDAVALREPIQTEDAGERCPAYSPTGSRRA
jgi:DNA-binding NtrC family response regulator